MIRKRSVVSELSRAELEAFAEYAQHRIMDLEHVATLILKAYGGFYRQRKDNLTTVSHYVPASAMIESKDMQVVEDVLNHKAGRSIVDPNWQNTRKKLLGPFRIRIKPAGLFSGRTKWRTSSKMQRTKQSSSY